MRNLVAATAALMLAACGPLPGGGSPVKVADWFLGVIGLTSDGYAILAEDVDESTTRITARPVTGGAETEVATQRWTSEVLISGQLVIGHSWSPTPGTMVWSAASGAHFTEEELRILPGTLETRSDGAFFTYQSVSSTGEFEAIVAPVDLSSKTAIYSGSTCLGRIEFAHQRLMSFHCGDVGWPIAVHAEETWAPLTLVSSVGSPSWRTDEQGQKAFVVASENGGPGTASLFDLATGAATLIEESALRPFISRDGSTLLYTVSGALRRFDVGSDGPVELVPEGVSFIDAVSPGFRWVLFEESASVRADAAEVVLVSTEAPSERQVLLQTSESGGFATFTEDDAYVLFTTSRAAEGSSFSYRATAGGDIQILADRVERHWRLRGSWVAYAQNPLDPAYGDTGVDLFLKDLSSGAEATLLASEVTLDSIHVQKDRSHVLYQVIGTEDASGVFGAALP